LPRYVIAKPLAGGKVAFYFNVPTRHRKLGCPIANEPLGNDYATACGTDGKGGRAAALNARFDEWAGAKRGEPIPGAVRYGSVDWLFREFKASIRYREKVSERSRPDYERCMLAVADMVTKQGDRVGDRLVKSLTPVGVDKIYERLCQGSRGQRLRQAEKVIVICRGAWKTVHRLYPDAFNRHVPNVAGRDEKEPRQGYQAAATREQVYKFAHGAIEDGLPEIAAAAVVCCEFLQRPENVLAGYLAWPDYRPKDAPTAIRIIHHKTGATVWHPLEETTDEGTIKFYADAEQMPRSSPAGQAEATGNVYPRRLSAWRHDGA
jgi:hypothetical protein